MQCSVFVFQCIFYTKHRCVFAVHATFGPLLLGGSRQWNQEVLCLTQPPPSSSTHCRGIWQCKESSSHGAVALLQCRETRHAQNVPPFSHSGGGRPLLPVTDLNHRIFSILDIRFTHGHFYRLICPLCVWLQINSCPTSGLCLSVFSEGGIHSSHVDAKWGGIVNTDFVFFSKFVQILDLISSTWFPVTAAW